MQLIQQIMERIPLRAIILSAFVSLYCASFISAYVSDCHCWSSFQKASNYSCINQCLFQDGNLKTGMKSMNLRSGASGITFYTYDYTISTTRGDKRIISAVGLYRNKLYIANGRIACSADTCDLETDLLQKMRQSIDSFDIVPA